MAINTDSHLRRDTSRSQANLRRAQQSLGRGVSSGLRASAKPTPIYIDKGYGARVTDVDGNEFVDHCLAWGPLILGHAHPAINEAVRRQLERGYTFGAQCELEIAVAEKIVEIVPCAERVLFSNTGSEAVQSALRVARSATGRQRVIKFEGHYHGWLDNVLVSYHPSLAQAGPPSLPHTVPTTGGQAVAAYADVHVLPWNDETAVAEFLEAHPSEVAAVITEPILCNSGCIMPAPGYLNALRKLCDRYGVVLIFDEVITGFRVSLGGAQQLFGVTPDLAVFGKAVGGGFTFSVVTGRESLLDEVASGRAVHAGTLNGNPLVLSAALATLEVLARDDGAALAKAAEYGEQVRQSIADFARQNGVPDVEVPGHGTVFKPMFGVAGVPRNYRDFAASDQEAAQTLVVELFESGIYCVPDGRWYVSAVHGDAELQFVRAALPEVFARFAGAYPRQESKR